MEIKRLKTGDYVCDDVYIERKTIDDFASSLMGKRKRLFKQFDRLLKCKYRFIVISGRIKDLKSKVHQHSIIGAIAWLAAHGVTVITVDTNEELAYLILKILEHHGKLKTKKFKYPKK